MSSRKRILLIPAFNEAHQLPRVLEAIRALAADFELVVVDDGSDDDTGPIATEFGARVIRHPSNLGYGAALQTGYKYACRSGASLVVQMDADGQHDPADVPALAAAIESGELDLVIGSRFLGDAEADSPKGRRYRMGVLQNLGRRMFRLLALRLGLEVTDPTSGFQALGPKALALYIDDFFPNDFPDVDVLVAAHRQGIRIGERPVTMSTGLRPSLLHGGLAPIYYVYKMLLSLWVVAKHSAP